MEIALGILSACLAGIIIWVVQSLRSDLQKHREELRMHIHELRDAVHAATTKIAVLEERLKLYEYIDKRFPAANTA